ncbi:MAG: FlxA-like family protein [Aquirhabdus sp.]
MSTLSGAAFADDGVTKEQLQQQMNELKLQMHQQQLQLDALIKAQERLNAAMPAPSTNNTAPVLANTTTQPLTTNIVARATASDTTIGGYGEIGYNNYRKDGSRDQADLKRFVLFFGHRFNDQLSFNSEVEWEHAVTSATDKGETEIEQAYLNYQVRPNINIKAGLFLMPFGFINESHEPPVFYGVERNEVETRIIPSTWREGGLGVNGSTEMGLDWNVGITTGFDVAKFDDASSPLHASHQELQLAKAHDLAYYGAVNYRGILGLTVGGALFTGNSIQANADFKADHSQPDFSGIKGRVTLGEVHTRWQRDGLDLQALYAKGKINDVGKIDDTLQAFNNINLDSRPYVPSEFYGWLVQGAYTVWQSGDMTLTPFLRYEKFNTQSKMPTGFTADPANADRVETIGVSFKPMSQVVFKADYQNYLDNSKNDRINLGLGYMF